MHQITGDRDEVLKLLDDTIRRLGGDGAKTRRASLAARGVTRPAPRAAQRARIVAALQRAYQHEQPARAVKAARPGARRGSAVEPNERAVGTTYAPRNREVALFQAAMDEYLEEQFGPSDPVRPPTVKRGATTPSRAGAKAKVSAKPTRAAFYAKGSAGRTDKGAGRGVGAAIGTQFSELDPRWIEVVTEKTKLLFKGNRKFIRHTSPSDFRFRLADTATVAIIGDWGGGNEAAQAVAAHVKALNPDHVIHLGDVYYAGTPKEVQDRFLKFWPAPAEAGRSLALNSNHEMYSGGYGYFDLALPMFKQPASYFSLGNEHWRFLGLDTGYVDHDLNTEQVEWLTAQFAGSFPRTILLSHHQLFSAYESTDTSRLERRVKPFLDRGQIFGWFWGHEHLNVVYADHLGIKARCLGNSCFPYDPPSKARTQVPVKWINRRVLRKSGEFAGVHSYAVLRFDGETVNIEYVDQDGVVGFTETWP